MSETHDDEAKKAISDGYHIGESAERPWGRWTVLDVGASFAVKRIEVSPGEMLSKQRHQYRAEHWLIASGEADIWLNDQQIRLGTGQSVDIPVGMIHRIGNPGTTALIFIEVQLGDRLMESDIERLADHYGR
ncbi:MULTISPECIES: phosphomannose isomerase type II C-terminal cupin domain [unclassified Iodidimonas]|jgi:mannose-6-phosphate isomerase-like protein (cupin superfamily)|uniref:phosphomannose isomerase type II C-terminal cupin domain n=1 Tax=unclassified Iodidimonas TaxID=2626145 RepID=UPI002482FF0F|nr:MULTISPECIES: phosphomannose isomerase type II C-terminal cupin domain [unclassified Iodidimonas]